MTFILLAANHYFSLNSKVDAKYTSVFRRKLDTHNFCALLLRDFSVCSFNWYDGLFSANF
jgi:hypothetical protein